MEVCATIKAVKYIYKYIFKGHDHAQVQIAAGVSLLSVARWCPMMSPFLHITLPRQSVCLQGSLKASATPLQAIYILLLTSC